MNLNALTKFFYWAAAFLTLAITGVHVVLGGPVFVASIIDSNLPEVVRWLGYFTWHTGTVTFLVMALAFGYAAIKDNTAVAVFAALIAMGMGILGLGVTIWGSPAMWGTPAPYAFSLIGLVGFAGVYASTRPPIDAPI
ncbi:MAG: hypothetical protein AAF512_01980 [Pseudomonadota bacterium]